MDKGRTCEHLNKLISVVGKELGNNKEHTKCYDCGISGSNLWICLQPDCHHIGCSEAKNDHSTIHHKNISTHCVHMNLSTERIWCYACEKEVHLRTAIAQTRIRPDSSSVGGSSAARLGFDRPVGLNVTLADDDPDDGEDIDYSQDHDTIDERPKGLVGLQNIGNTCYMNAALQALSNTVPLTNYFIDCSATVTVLTADKKPGLSRSYQKLIKDMWNNRNRGYVVPNAILYGIRSVHPMFRGYHQHDTQEFLRCFMDQLHEELKEPIWDSMGEEKLTSDADGDHQGPRNIHMRRRAASSGASDAPIFARMRRKSPAPSTLHDSRTDGYLRVHSQSECANAERGANRHQRSASFAGTHFSTYTVHTAHYNVADSVQRDVGSESELSCSSETEDRYETCSSGASDTLEPRTDAPTTKESGCGGGDGGGVRYRSVVSDVFDGKLLSSVQCLICDRVSTRVETFQDLSLPIPSREYVNVLRNQQSSLSNIPPLQLQDSWVWWLLSWLRSWFYGPVVSLQDCLAAFFSADELKGDNMYSCSRCNKLRNGVKMSGVVHLPEVLCVHLKRFRHELMFSSKVGARVAFPLYDLNMAPYLHKDCTSKITKYELCSVICHTGTAGGGHYTCMARNGRTWYEFDDQCVTQVSPAAVAQSEAYVLFYRKVNSQMALLRQKAAEIMESYTDNPNDIKFYISKQWINKFNTWAEPGPIDNSDVFCVHGSVRPDRAPYVYSLTACVSQDLWEFLYANFGGGPPCSHVHECASCAQAAELLRNRCIRELTIFYELHAAFQGQTQPEALLAISMPWFRQWQNFVRGHSQRPPPSVDNSPIVTKQEIDGKTTYVLKQGSDYAQINDELWRFFTEIYGGGPEVKLKTPTQIHIPETPVVYTNDNCRTSRKYSESDKEDYCAKSTSETNIRTSIVGASLQKNQSLQNINRNHNSHRTESDDEVNYKVLHYMRHEPNGTYQDSDDDMDTSSTLNVNPRLENGFDSSDHDTNDKPLCQKIKSETNADVELPNLDRISLKTKSTKSGKVRKVKRRTVK